MRLLAIGTGTAAPHPRRVQSGLLVETRDARVLVDCGSGVVFRCAQLGVAWQQLTHVVLTHYHADHTNDLANLFYAWRYGQLPPREAPLQLIGPPGLRARVQGMVAAFGESLLEEPPPISLIELEAGGQLLLGEDVELASRKVPHTAESVAYSISARGRRVVVTGDTGFDPELGAWAEGCDVLVSECSLPDAMAIAAHLTPRQCGALAAIARPHLLALTHFYPPVEHVDIAAEVAESFSGPVVLCEDGWSYHLEAP